jgi:hypothetical protein
MSGRGPYLLLNTHLLILGYAEVGKHLLDDAFAAKTPFAATVKNKIIIFSALDVYYNNNLLKETWKGLTLHFGMLEICLTRHPPQ